MEFNLFWAQYPRKVGKLTAQRSWQKMPDDHKQKALEAIVEHRKYWTVKGTDWEFIPHASTWLNQERYFDEIVIEQKEKKKEVIGWHRSDEGTLAKGREVGCQPYPGESMDQYRQRLHRRILELEGQM
jgi:hypothetical protein